MCDYKNGDSTSVIYDEFNKGFLIVPMLGQYNRCEIEGFTHQNITSLLYDLDLLEEQCDLDTIKGMQRFVVAKTLRQLHSENMRLKDSIVKFKERYDEVEWGCLVELTIDGLVYALGEET